MNKKGWGLDFISLFVILFIVTVMIAVTHAPTQEIRQQQINKTITALDWNTNFAHNFALKPDDGSLATVTINIAYTFVNALGYTFCEVSKAALRLAVASPELNWMLIFFLVTLAILAPGIIVIVRVIVLICILLSEWIIQKKEKRRLKNAKAKLGN